MTILDGENPYHCVVRGDDVECGELFSTSDGNIEGAEVDSPAVFETWKNNLDWNELMAQDDISILLQLKPGAEDGPLTWNALVTVHGATEAPYGGNFKWIPETGATEFNTY